MDRSLKDIRAKIKKLRALAARTESPHEAAAALGAAERIARAHGLPTKVTTKRKGRTA